MSSTPQPTPVTLRDYLQTLWSRRWLVVAVAVACVLGALFYSSRQTPVYQSSSQVLVQPVYVAVPGQGGGSFIDMDNEVRIASSGEVATMAADDVEREGASPAFVSVSSPGGNVLLFSASSPDPRAAQLSAQARADAYIEFRKAGLTGNVDAALDRIEDRLGALRTDLSEAEQRFDQATETSEIEVARQNISSLASQIASLEGLRNDLLLGREITVGQILDRAFLPASPSRPDHGRDGVFGLFIGVALGIGLAFLWERLDQRIRSREDVEASAQVAVLGMIPKVARVGPRLVMSPGGDAAAAEAYRALRARVAFAASQAGMTTVLITSPNKGEGKTTTAANLATAFAQSEKRVVLVSADLRLPTLERYFVHDPEGRGLSDIMEHGAELGDAIVRTDVPNLWLIPSGSAPQLTGNLGSEIMTGLLAQVAEDADIVMIDTPPVLQASDALDLAPATDAVLLVVDPKRSNKQTVAEAADDLRSVGANLIGVVVSGFDPERFRSYERRRYYDYSTADHRTEAKPPLPAPAIRDAES
jgi:capsular exopolysaccharide synthesis family protein